jgi:hypothetical protein
MVTLASLAIMAHNIAQHMSHVLLGCSKIVEAEAAVSVNEKKWLVMHMHVQLQLDELRGPQPLGSL